MVIGNMFFLSLLLVKATRTNSKRSEIKRSLIRVCESYDLTAYNN